MMKSKSKPTAAELEILNVLWNKSSATVREVHEVLHAKKDVGYTTTLKIMQNMTAKGYLRREQNGKSHIYFPSLKKEEVQENLLDKFLESAFGGSASKLVMHLLDNKSTSKKELEEIKALINKYEEGE